MATGTRKTKKRTHKEIMQAFLEVVGGVRNARSAFSLIRIGKRKVQVVASKELTVGEVKGMMAAYSLRIEHVPDETLWIDAIALIPTGSTLPPTVTFAYAGGTWEEVVRISGDPSGLSGQDAESINQR